MPVACGALDDADFTMTLSYADSVKIQKGELDAGVHSMEWDLRDDAGHRTRPGVFFLRARTGDEEFLRRVVVLR